METSNKDNTEIKENLESTTTEINSNNNTSTPIKTEDKNIFILDTAFFIQLKQLQTENVYYTTNFVITEIRDEKARDNYNINKDFIKIRDPSKESLKTITKFARKSNDLYNLSITDISIIALAYEISLEKSSKSNENNKIEENISSLRKEPLEWIIRKRAKKSNKEKTLSNEPEDDGFVEVKTSKTNKNKDKDKDFKLKKDVEDILNDDNSKSDDEEDRLWNEFNEYSVTEGDKVNIYKENDWINETNVNDKLIKFIKYEDALDKENKEKNNKNETKIYTITDDFTMQNVLLKIGLNVLSVNGLIVKRIKNFL